MSSGCRVLGAARRRPRRLPVRWGVHLDQLRVDGWCSFATTPTGIRWVGIFPRWWSVRNSLAEEHHWRAQARRPVLARGWNTHAFTKGRRAPGSMSSRSRTNRTG